MKGPSARAVGIGVVVTVIAAALIAAYVGLAFLASAKSDESRATSQFAQVLQDNDWTLVDARDISVGNGVISTEVNFGTNGCHFDATASRNNPQQVTLDLRRVLGKQKTIGLLPYAVALNNAANLGVSGCVGNK